MVRLYKRYVDDANLKLIALGPGAVWDAARKTIVYVEPDLDERQPDKRTAEVVKCIADSITSMLVWTVDYPSANPMRRLPILDIETWCEETMEGTRTCYSFYQKPMANPVVIPSVSAVPNSVRFSTFRQEVGRILRNTSAHLPWSHKATLLSSFSWRLKVSVYTSGFRSVIRSQKRNKKTVNNWFNFSSEAQTYDTVIFVPSTRALP